MMIGHAHRERRYFRGRLYMQLHAACVCLLLAAAAAGSVIDDVPPTAMEFTADGVAAAVGSGWNVTHSCSIARIASTHPNPLQAFTSAYKGRTPVVFSVGTANAALRPRFAVDALLREHGSVPVILSSSNSHAKHKQHTSLADYLLHHLAPQTPLSLANETWYLFGDSYSDEWKALQEGYVPPLDAARDDPLPAIGIAGRFSGVSFHTHGPAFGESIVGAKRWYLYPPEQRPVFNVDQSQLQWEIYLQALQSSPPLACTVHEGEGIYIPSGWWHATLNIDDYNVFASVFVHEAGPRKQ